MSQSASRSAQVASTGSEGASPTPCRPAHEEDPPVRIGVVAYQWQWQFVYAPRTSRWEDCGAPENKGKCVTIIGVPPPGGDRTNWQPPQMHVPVNETVELQMHATDVIHSFYVPAFLYQRDITPRKDQVIQFLADREGTYRGQCTQFCGLLHHAMEFEVVVEPRAAFDAWLVEKLTPPATPTPAPSTSVEPGASAEPGGSVTIAITAWIRPCSVGMASKMGVSRGITRSSVAAPPIIRWWRG